MLSALRGCVRAQQRCEPNANMGMFRGSHMTNVQTVFAILNKFVLCVSMLTLPILYSIMQEHKKYT